MKRVNRKDVIKMIQKKGNKTFKELAEMTGYHEKSLSRIWKKMQEGSYTEIHRNKGRIPHNKITDKEKEKVIEQFKEKKYATKKEFYKDLCKKGYTYSYSFIAKLITIERQKKKDEKKNPKWIVIPRKLIATNIIQYRNKRYWIKKDSPIPHHANVSLVVNCESLEPLFIRYKKKKYFLIYQKDVISKKGNTKY